MSSEARWIADLKAVRAERDAAIAERDALSWQYQDLLHHHNTMFDEPPKYLIRESEYDALVAENHQLREALEQESDRTVPFDPCSCLPPDSPDPDCPVPGHGSQGEEPDEH